MLYKVKHYKLTLIGVHAKLQLMSIKHVIIYKNAIGFAAYKYVDLYRIRSTLICICSKKSIIHRN